MLDHNLPWCVLEGISTHYKGSWNLKDAPWGHSTLRHPHTLRSVIMRALWAEYFLTGHPSKTKKVPRNWVMTLAFPLEKNFETKSVSARSLTAQRVLTAPFTVLFWDVIYGIRVPARSQCSSWTPLEMFSQYQNECSKHILCVGNFPILGFHLNVSKGNFLNYGISPKWGWWFSHYSLLAKWKRREQKPSCHQRWECYFPRLV